MRYTIVRTVEKLSQKRNDYDGSVDYVIRRGFRALPTEEVDRFIANFQSDAVDATDALALFEIEDKDILPILGALQVAAREIEVKEVLREKS